MPTVLYRPFVFPFKFLFFSHFFEDMVVKILLEQNIKVSNIELSPTLPLENCPER